MVRARTIYIDFNIVFSTAFPEPPCLLEPPKASSTSLRISEGYCFDAALEDEHSLRTLLLYSVLSPSVNATPWIVGLMRWFFDLQAGRLKHGAAFAETLIALRTINGNFAFKTFISVFLLLL